MLYPSANFFIKTRKTENHKFSQKFPFIVSLILIDEIILGRFLLDTGIYLIFGQSRISGRLPVTQPDIAEAKKVMITNN